MRRRPLSGAWAVAAAVVLSGCVFGVPDVRLPRATADDLLHSLATRRAAVTSLRARARIRDGLASLWTREAVLLQRPATLRIDVLSPFGLALALGTDGTILWAYPPQDGVRYEGPATAENLARVLGAPIAIEDLVQVLLGLPPERDLAGTPQLETTATPSYHLTLPLADGRQELWFGGEPLALVRATETRTGQTELQVTFSEHDAGLPHAIEVVVPSTGNTVTLRYDAVEVNPALDAALFAPPPAPAVRPLPTGTRG